MKFRPTNLLDLPVKPYDRDAAVGTSLIQDAYLKERGALTEPSHIRPFIHRWRALFTLMPGPKYENEMKIPSRAKLDLEAMLNGSFDAKRVLSVIADGGQHYNNDDRSHRIAANILVPPALMMAFQLSNHYGVMHDLGMVRLYLDTWPKLDNTLGH